MNHKTLALFTQMAQKDRQIAQLRAENAQLMQQLSGQRGNENVNERQLGARGVEKSKVKPLRSKVRNR
jgi:DNA-binding protein H-NS